jgi:phospholipid/cholesterol/gamma-HCH transport system substrate-binding protein
MMRRTDMTWTQLKVGIVIISAVAAILYTIMNLNSGMGVFTAASPFHASLEDSQGIKAGAPVRISGVDVGNVKGVSIDPGKGKVVIEFTVNNDMRPLLHTDAAIMIRPMGLLGDKYLDLLPGSPKQPPLPDGAVLSGRGDTADITGVASSATATLEHVNQTLGDLQKILGGISAGKGTAGKLVTDPELYDQTTQLIKKIDGVSEKTGQLITKIERGDGTLGKLITDRSFYDRANAITMELEKLAVTLNRPDGSIGRLARDPALYNRLESLTTKGEGLVDKIERGDGTLGKLVTQDQLYKRADKLLTEMEGLIADIKKDPKRYFKFSVF